MNKKEKLNLPAVQPESVGTPDSRRTQRVFWGVAHQQPRLSRGAVQPSSLLSMEEWRGRARKIFVLGTAVELRRSFVLGRLVIHRHH